MSKICHNCQASNGNSDAFCWTCGSQLQTNNEISIHDNISNDYSDDLVPATHSTIESQTKKSQSTPIQSIFGVASISGRVISINGPVEVSDRSSRLFGGLLFLAGLLILVYWLYFFFLNFIVILIIVMIMLYFIIRSFIRMLPWLTSLFFMFSPNKKGQKHRLAYFVRVEEANGAITLIRFDGTFKRGYVDLHDNITAYGKKSVVPSFLQRDLIIPSMLNSVYHKHNGF